MEQEERILVILRKVSVGFRKNFPAVKTDRRWVGYPGELQILHHQRFLSVGYTGMRNWDYMTVEALSNFHFPQLNWWFKMEPIFVLYINIKMAKQRYQLAGFLCEKDG